VLEPTLEQKTSKLDIEVNNNYQIESMQTPLDYSGYTSSFSFEMLEQLDLSADLLGNKFPITSTEASEVETILENIRTNEITSYSDFIDASKNFSEIQKIAMLAAIGNSLYNYGYDLNYQFMEKPSRDGLFSKLQNILNNNTDSVVGACGQIASSLERLANDNGLRAATVTGISLTPRSHAFNVLKLQDGSAIVSGGNIILFSSKNIEKLLETYQLYYGSLVFYHSFFEDSKFKYRLITRKGKNIADFLGYDSSTDTIKKALFNEMDSNPNFMLNLAEKNYLTSKKLNLFGFFSNFGEIREDQNSQINKIPLIQAGYKGNFSLLEFSIIPTISLVYGNMQYKDNTKTGNNLYGISGDLIASKKNKQDLNFSFRFGYNLLDNLNLFTNKYYNLFYDFPIEAGISYKIQTKDLYIEPYLLSQFNSFPDLETWVFTPQITELKGGIVFGVPMTKDAIFSFEPFYSKRNYEQEIGAGIKLKTKNLALDVKGYASNSTYDFAPDRMGISVNTSFPLGNSEITIDYKNDTKNYDREKEDNSSFSINGKIKY